MPNPDGSETPQEKLQREAAERQAQQAVQRQTAGYTPTPFVDPGLNRAQIKEGEHGGAWTNLTDAKTAANVAAGNALPGSFQNWGGQVKQDIVRTNLSRAEADAQRRQNFGFGSGNNAESAAMIGEAQGTANRFSDAFGGMAGTAADRSAAANGRGTSMFAGDTSQYNKGLDNAQQSRGMQTGAYGQLMDFAGKGPGPSAAQAQLTQATDANTQNALAMARSGRGMGGGQAAMRQAIGQNAATQQGAAGQMAELRANENTAFQNQKLNALNAAGGIAGQTVAGDQAYGKLGLEGAQYQTDTKLKGTQLNDTTAQAWADQQRAATADAHAAELAGQTQTMNVNAQALAGRQAEEDAIYRQTALERGETAAAQANRQATTNALIGAGASTAAAISDERAKTNIKPLSGITPGAPQSLNGIAPISIKAPLPPPIEEPAPGPSADERSKERAGAIGGTAGKLGGGAIGGFVGGPIGAFAGSAIGGLAGKALGKVFSDVRSKSNVEPLSKRKPASGAYGDLEAIAEKYGAAGVATSPGAVERYAGTPADRGPEVSALPPEKQKGFDAWLKRNNVTDLDHPDSHYDYRGAYLAGEGRGPGASGHFTDRFKQHGHETFSTQSQYSKGGKDGGDWVDDTYLPEAAQDRASKVAGRYARGGTNQILSEGDALLADSARASPPSAYDYKNPEAPGAKPGRQVGPMAQDLAAHPVTRGVVDRDPATGLLQVDGARAATVGLAQNHSQQNQLDDLNDQIAKLEGMLKRKPGDSRTTDFKRDQRAGGLL